MMDYLHKATRNLFFTGKGGVGKTTLACATAIALADRGKRVLLVSTDPASNLDEVLGVMLSNSPTPVPTVPGLLALNIDPEEAAREYRERVVGPYRDVLPATAIARMEEQLSGSCTVEIAAFNEFSRLLGAPDATVEFDHVVFDTAPTGHTLRLLSLPSAWTGFIDANTTGTSCLGPLAGLQGQRELYEATVSALSNAGLTTLVLVSRPDSSALAEAARCSRELALLGVGNQHLVLNGIFHALTADDQIAVAMERRCREALTDLPEPLATFPRTGLALTANSLLGIAALRAFFDADGWAVSDEADSTQVATTPLPPDLNEVGGRNCPARTGSRLNDGQGRRGKNHGGCGGCCRTGSTRPSGPSDNDGPGSPCPQHRLRGATRPDRQPHRSRSGNRGVPGRSHGNGRSRP